MGCFAVGNYSHAFTFAHLPILSKQLFLPTAILMIQANYPLCLIALALLFCEKNRLILQEPISCCMSSWPAAGNDLRTDRIGFVAFSAAKLQDGHRFTIDSHHALPRIRPLAFAPQAARRAATRSRSIGPYT